MPKNCLNLRKYFKFIYFDIREYQQYKLCSNVKIYIASTYVTVQTKKMHDLYATKHISEIILPDTFWAV